MTLEKLSGLDATFLAAETRTNHMHMMAIMVLDPETVPGGYSFEKLRDFINERLPLIPPLRRKLVEVPFGLDRPYWVDCADVELDLHLRRAAVPQPGGPREIGRMVEEINSRQLDRSRPLWEIYVVEGALDGSIVLLAKVHHALMDGMAGMRFMGVLVSSTPETEKPPTPVSESTSPARVPHEVELLARAIPTWLSKPLRIANVGRHVLQTALRSALATNHVESDEPPVTVTRNMLNGRLTPERSAAYDALPIADIQQVGRAFSATINEVVLAMVGGALRRFYEANGEPLDVLTVAGAPVSTHDVDGDDLTNSYRAMFANIGTNIADPVERLESIRHSSRAEKKRARAFWGEALGDIAELPSPMFMGLVMRSFVGLELADHVTPPCNLVVSNVPGPPTELYFAGARLRDIYALGPLFEGVGLNITAISVGDNLDVGISAGREFLPDVWPIAEGLRESLTELVALIPGTLVPPSDDTTPTNTGTD